MGQKTNMKVEDLDLIIQQFLLIIESGNEHETHKYLVNHPVLLSGFAFGSSRSITHIFSQYSLGDELVPDFILIGDPISPNWIEPTVTLVEIESPRHRLFTKTGDPTAALTHAIRQIRDWRLWIKNNRAYFERRLADKVLSTPPLTEGHRFELERDRLYRHGVYEAYTVVIGRQGALDDSNRQHLRELADVEKVRVLTYDAIIELAREIYLWKERYDR